MKTAELGLNSGAAVRHASLPGAGKAVLYTELGAVYVAGMTNTFLVNSRLVT